MKKLNPVERTQYIKNRYKEYLRSSFQFGNGEIQDLFWKELDEADLFRGPYVALNLPFKRGKSLKELANEGVICQSFLHLSDIDFSRPLYVHQEEAIRKIGAGRSAIVTTGTGSGKTECFLYPILNELLKDIENGNHEEGIRAIFLYPMNALVNDQIERVRKILINCPDITFAFFTGDTKESVAQDFRKQHQMETGEVIPQNELVSREEIRRNPPHLLFTNYSMLEFMLIRPNDYVLFSPRMLKNWKFVVLDEAHTYSGSLGIEISMLLRRLTGFAPKKPRFILTSATLGEKGKSENEIVDFAVNLTSASFQVDDIIFSKRIEMDAARIKYNVSSPDYLSLKANLDNLNAVAKICNNYHVADCKDISEYLYELLSSDGTVYSLYEMLKDGSKEFDQIQKEISTKIKISKEELISLIDLINKAEKN